MGMKKAATLTKTQLLERRWSALGRDLQTYYSDLIRFSLTMQFIVVSDVMETRFRRTIPQFYLRIYTRGPCRLELYGCCAGLVQREVVEADGFATKKNQILRFEVMSIGLS
jgi:hypothetical protein